MSKETVIYTAGKMKGENWESQIEWRKRIERLVCINTDKPVKFIHPPYYYNYINPSHKTEQEVKEWELSQIERCDILIVNLDNINESVGSHFEIAHAAAMNRNGGKHIFIIGIGDDTNVHPWIKTSLFRCEKTLIQAAVYIAEYLLS